MKSYVLSVYLLYMDLLRNPTRYYVTSHYGTLYSDPQQNQKRSRAKRIKKDKLVCKQVWVIKTLRPEDS